MFPQTITGDKKQILEIGNLVEITLAKNAEIYRYMDYDFYSKSDKFYEQNRLRFCVVLDKNNKSVYLKSWNPSEKMIKDGLGLIEYNYEVIVKIRVLNKYYGCPKV